MQEFKKSFKVPFKYLYKKREKSLYEEQPYKIETIYHPLPSKNMKMEKDIDLKELQKSFPKKIDKVYWYQEGINSENDPNKTYDEKDWLAVGRMKYGNEGNVKYFYFEASSCYTGFDCIEVHMNLYVSSKLKNIKMYAIPKNSEFFNQG